MKKKSFCSAGLVAQELDKFRCLKGFCEHDLKSSVGVVKGFVQILMDELGPELSGSHREFLEKSLYGTEKSLAEIEENLRKNLPQFITVWWISENPPQGDCFDEAPVLFLHIDDLKQWELVREGYRPQFVFLDQKLTGERTQEVIQKTGPFFSKIYLIADDSWDESEMKSLNLQGRVPPTWTWQQLLRRVTE